MHAPHLPSASPREVPLAEDGPRSPRATRGHRAVWRDPRLAVGAVLVGASVLAGAVLLGGGDTAAEVLAARGPLVAGQRLEPDDLTTVRVHFTSPAAADRYLPADAELRPGATVGRVVGAGELVPREAVLAGPEDPLLELPLAVDPMRVPAGLGAGARVDVWLVPPPDRAGTVRAQRLLSSVPVLSVGRASAVAASGARQVVVGVPDGDGLARTVGGLDPTRMLVVRRGR